MEMLIEKLREYEAHPNSAVLLGQPMVCALLDEAERAEMPRKAARLRAARVILCARPDEFGALKRHIDAKLSDLGCVWSSGSTYGWLLPDEIAARSPRTADETAHIRAALA